MKPSSPHIFAQHVAYSVRNHSIIHDFALEGYRGEIVGLLGPNGAGKTTAMRLLSGNLLPQSGTIHIDGHVPSRQPVAVAKKLGYLPEGAPLWEERSVLSSLLYVSACHQLSGQTLNDRLRIIIDLLDLSEVLTTKVRLLSKGLRRRTGLALALIPDPPILILDEPSDGLDPNQQTVLHKALAELAKKKTILLSTHNLEEARTLCHRLVILNQGRVVAHHFGEELKKLLRTQDVLKKHFMQLTQGK